MSEVLVPGRAAVARGMTRGGWVSFPKALGSPEGMQGGARLLKRSRSHSLQKACVQTALPLPGGTEPWDTLGYSGTEPEPLGPTVPVTCSQGPRSEPVWLTPATWIPRPGPESLVGRISHVTPTSCLSPLETSGSWCGSSWTWPAPCAFSLC